MVPVRTLAVKPDDQHFYGRVVRTRHLEGFGKRGGGGFAVKMTYRRNNAYCHTRHPFNVGNLQIGDLVLIKEYGCPVEAWEDGYNDNFPILMVYYQFTFQSAC